jgi:50S ribosomal protein L16 3-hydroxylase
MKLSLLGGLTARQFLRDYWQKRPLLVRGAIPGFQSLIEPERLFELASRDDVESRLVKRRRNGWDLSRGPFRRSDLRRAPQRNWTLLVQDLNLFVPEAKQLLMRF